MTVEQKQYNIYYLITVYCSGRDTSVCKVCRMDHGEDWLGCDRCSQFFHASCVGVDFATAVLEYFCCP